MQLPFAFFFFLLFCRRNDIIKLDNSASWRVIHSWRTTLERRFWELVTRDRIRLQLKFDGNPVGATFSSDTTVLRPWPTRQTAFVLF